MLNHLQRFYDALNKIAEKTDNGKHSVFRGKTTQVFNTLDLPSPYYHKMMRLLVGMQCIEQVQRGARHVESVINLHKRPVLEDFIALDPQYMKDARSESQRAFQVTTDARIRDIEQNLGGLSIQNLAADHETRIINLENQIKNLLSNNPKLHQGETKP